MKSCVVRIYCNVPAPSSGQTVQSTCTGGNGSNSSWTFGSTKDFSI